MSDDVRRKAEEVWRAVVTYLDEDGVVVHRDCPRDQPDECTLFEVILDAMKAAER